MSHTILGRGVVLFFAIASSSFSQTRVGQCSTPPLLAARPDGIAPIASTLAGKPEKSRGKLQPVAPQIQFPRPPASSPSGCWCGNVTAGSLTSATASQEVPMISGLAGTFRIEHILIQETQRFASELVNRLAVTARPKVGEDFISEFELKSETAPQNFAHERPVTPPLSGTYDLILRFTGSSPLAIQGVSNFGAGSLRWEVCGYRVQ